MLSLDQLILTVIKWSLKGIMQIPFFFSYFLIMFFDTCLLKTVLIFCVRLNLPTTFSMSLEVMGHELQFSQVCLILRRQGVCAFYYFQTKLLFSGVLFCFVLFSGIFLNYFYD